MLSRQSKRLDWHKRQRGHSTLRQLVSLHVKNEDSTTTPINHAAHAIEARDGNERRPFDSLAAHGLLVTGVAGFMDTRPRRLLCACCANRLVDTRAGRLRRVETLSGASFPSATIQADGVGPCNIKKCLRHDKKAATTCLISIGNSGRWQPLQRAPRFSFGTTVTAAG